MAAYRSTGKELRKSPKGLVAGILSVLLAAGAAYGIKLALDGIEPITNGAAQTEISVPETSDLNRPTAVAREKL